MPLSLLVDTGSLPYALVNVFHLDWLIRSNFWLCRSDNSHKDSYQNSWIYPRVKTTYKNAVGRSRCSLISKSNVNNILAVFSGTSISQALAADDSMEQQTVVRPERTSRSELSKFGGRRSLFITTWL